MIMIMTCNNKCYSIRTSNYGAWIISWDSLRACNHNSNIGQLTETNNESAFLKQTGRILKWQGLKEKKTERRFVNEHKFQISQISEPIPLLFKMLLLSCI